MTNREHYEALCPEMAKHSEEVVRKMGRNDPCWCGSGKKYKACHAAFDDKLKKYALMGKIVPDHSIIKTPEQIEKIKESCVITLQSLTVSKRRSTRECPHRRSIRSSMI